MLIFYTLQGEEGEDPRHPNAFDVSPASPGAAVLLGDVLRGFPLRGKGSFHFRFRLPEGLKWAAKTRCCFQSPYSARRCQSLSPG